MDVSEVFKIRSEHLQSSYLKGNLSLFFLIPLKLKLKFEMKCYLTGSVTSLAAGLFFGLLAAVGAYLASQNPRNVWLSLGKQAMLFQLYWYKNRLFTLLIVFNFSSS